MKKRVYRIMNFFAFNLLFFSLYLNFIHKDKNVQAVVHSAQTNQVQGTVLVENPDEYLKKNNAGVSEHTTATQKESSSTMQLSIN